MIQSEKGKIAIWIVSIIMIVLGIVLLLFGDEIASDAFKESFNNTVKQTSSEKQNNNIINKIVSDLANSSYHVSNRASINVDDIKNKNKLAVLKASDTFLKVTDPKTDSSDSQRWTKIPGEAYYTVDLSMSEFVVDEYKHFVIVRLSRPQLENVTIDSSNAEILLYNYEKQIFKTNGSYKDGSAEAQNDLKEARIELYNRFYTDQKFYKAAEESAKQIITAMIKAFNPEVEDLQVEVDFIGNSKDET